jgi:SAM-dependent methyltransferase
VTTPVASDFRGSMPEHYDGILGPAQFEALAADLARRLPVRPPGDVLEVASGTGITTRQLRKRLDPALRLVATDLSKAMLDYGRLKLREMPGIEWREADAVKLPFADASFGALVCALGIMFVPDKKAAFREARRVLRGSGVLLFNVWDSLEHNPQARANSEVFESLFPGDPEMQFAKIPYGFYDRDVLTSHVTAAGFSKPRIEPMKFEIHCQSARLFATGTIKGTPRALLIEQRGISLDEAIDKVAVALARVGGSEPFRCPAQALAITAEAV